MRKKLFAILILAVIFSALIYGVYFFFVSSQHVTTDNAYVNAEIAQVTSSVAGTIQTIHVHDTQYVHEHDVLVDIDDIDAKIGLCRAQAECVKAEVELNRAQIDYKRRNDLIKSGSVSGEELSNSDNNLRSAQATYDMAKASVDQAQVDLNRTKVRAPINGIVVRRQVQLGQRVQAGTSLMWIVPIEKLHVDANFKEVQLKKISIGQSVKLTSDLYGGAVVYHGKVSGLSGGTGAAFALIPAQNATGNWIKVVHRLPVRIELDPEELKSHPLRVGLSMFVDIDVVGVTNTKK